ncbi:MAG TPA: SBBP repeat-containing protein, partial [Terriglobales bacterium]
MAKGSAAPADSGNASPAKLRTRVLEHYLQLPLSFEANRGQADKRVRFLSRGDGYKLFLTSTGAEISTSATSGGDSTKSNELAIDVLSMKLLGANLSAVINGTDQLPGKANYFIGNEPSQWYTNVPTYRRVQYRQVYHGIDLVYYGNHRELEYDFSVKPGGDPNVIRLAFDKMHKLHVQNDGSLALEGRSGFQLRAPVAYQQIDGQKRMVAARWVLTGKHQARFQLGVYDPTKQIVIDPVLAYSTYIGGSNGDSVTAVAVDSSGNGYIAGFTGSTNFLPSPTLNAFQGHCNGCTGGGTNNAFVVKLDPTGTTVIYSTYLGGDNGDAAFGIAVDASGNAYVVGSTHSGGGTGHIPFPTANAFQPTCAGGCTQGDAFVTSLSADGSTLNYSSFLGGSGQEDGNAIAVDASGNAYVTGDTNSSAASGGFPVTTGAVQTTYG